MIGSSLVARWHVDLLVMASAMGLVVALCSWRRPASAPPWAALGAVLILGGRGVVPDWTVAAVVVAVVAGVGAGDRAGRVAAISFSRAQRGLPALRVPAVVLAAGATRSGPALATVTVVVVGLVAAVGVDGAVRRLPPSVVGWLVAGSAAVLWLCVPDTEAVLAVGAASVGPAALISLSTRCRAPSRLVDTAGGAEDRGGDWFPLVLLLTWALAEGFRGRPGGLPAAWVVLASLAAWPLADAVVARWRPRAPTLQWPQWMPYLVAVAAIAVVAARTVGLSDDLDADLAPAAMSVLAALGLWLRLAWRTRLPSLPDAAKGSPS